MLEDFIPQLLEILPMNKAIFLSKLKGSGLLSDDVKAKIKSVPTLVDKAECFLDEVILPYLPDDPSNLDKLLSVMENYTDSTLKNLAAEISKCLYTE